MIKKTIKYKNFNEEDRTMVGYFHLNKMELMEMEVGEAGGLYEQLKKITDGDVDQKKMVNIFKNFVLLSYGERTEDGEGFDKSPEVRKKFEQSNAFPTLFMELATSSDKAAEFINGIVPKDIQAEIKNNANKGN